MLLAQQGMPTVREISHYRDPDTVMKEDKKCCFFPTDKRRACFVIINYEATPHSSREVQSSDYKHKTTDHLGHTVSTIKNKL